MSNFPNSKDIKLIVNQVREWMFPAHFSEWQKYHGNYQEFTSTLKKKINWQIGNVFNDFKKSEEITKAFFEELPKIKEVLEKDAEAGFLGDPAAYNVDEIILSYPGFFAVFVYRISHFLFNYKIPYIPRMMSEYAHSKTGIDIHPGAQIAEYFFIDHGTGVVIGETTIVMKNVKIYQGVTLGALSTKSGQKLAGVKRHPTIEENVTIYAGATILGGETVIGRDSVIGGNCFVIKSVAANSKIKGCL